MGTKGFLIYLVSGFSIAILSVFFLNSDNRKLNVIQLYDGSLYTHKDYFKHGVRVWPDLEFNWRSTLVTIVGFLGSAFGTVGGVGGGGIFVPMLNLIVGFDAKSAAALSKCMIMGASASSFWYNIRVSHPTRDAPIIDYDLAVLFQPMLMLGITIGVSLSVIFPYWLITLLIIILFMGTSSRSFCKGIRMWKDETVLLEEEKIVKAPNSGVNVDPDYEALVPPEEKTGLKIILFNIRWKKILVLMIVWILFLLLQALKNQTAVCSPIFWVLNISQVPVAMTVFMYQAIKLNRDSKNRILRGNTEPICQASIQWTPFHLLFCALCGLCGGTVGGLLGSGGGFILGPLLLEIGVIPQVASATATFVMLFSSSLSVVEFYFLKRFPMLYAMYLIAVSMLAGFWGQFFVRKMVKILNRASIIVFILSAVIVASALTMGIVGIEKSIYMINHHQYMGFFPFCQ